MSMRINSVFEMSELYKTSRSNDKQRVSRSEEKKDSLALSAKAKDYNTAMKAISDIPDFRSELVDSVKARVEGNQYTVSAQSVADKLLERVFSA